MTPLDLLFPPRCFLCGEIRSGLSRGLCGPCEASLPAPKGGAFRTKGEFFDPCLSPFLYRDELADALQRFKFSGKALYAAPLGARMAALLPLFEREFDLVTWVPVGPFRRLTRGYDQSRLLARSLCRAARLPKPVRLLEKRRDNTAQSSLPPERRRANVLGVYRAREGFSLEGARILLVDDIVTSGSTLSEAARVLLTAGAFSVSCVTAAKA